jgi:hypothetical protein
MISSGNSRSLVLVVIIILSCATNAPILFAQDSHYWTNQFGNRARLLGGAVFGSTDDLSAVYYNPGSLALVDRSAILLSGSVFEVTNVKVKNTVADKEASFWDAQLSPSLFAGEIGSKEKGQNRFAYSFLTRYSGKLRIDSLATATGEDFLPELEFVGADFRVDNSLSEYWLGGTYASPIGDDVGLGVSMFFAFRSQRGRVESTSQALAPGNRAAVINQTRDFSYWHWRVLWKIGLATYLQKWRVGITVTTPSLGIGGRGDVTYDDTFVGQAVDDQGNPLTFIALDQQKVGSNYKSPVSIGFGAARRFGKSRVHLAAEWFNETSPFTVLDTEPFQAQSSGETITTDLVRELDQVFNVAVGLEHDVNERLHGYAGFRTDFSGLNRSSSGTDAVTLLNIYHVSGGATVMVKDNEFTLGGVLSFGSAPIARDLIIPEGLEFSTEATVSYFRFLAILGFSFEF